MAVDFCDYFWGPENNGFHVLYQNMKSGVTATKEITEFARETALMQEYNSKAYAKLSKQMSASHDQVGSFGPMLHALETTSKKLATIHSAMLTKVSELVKEIVKYSEDLHKKHKAIKDEESGTSNVVKSLQETTSLLQKSHDFYKAKATELEKVKTENASPKELEKAESKFRKSQEDYKTLVEKYSSVREDFEKKMASSCKHFQQSETLYLTQMVDFTHSLHELIDNNHNQIGQVHLELEENLVQNTVEKMLDQFVRQKYTGLIKPKPVEFEPETISLTSLNAAIPGGPPSDISDRSANSDKQSTPSVGTASIASQGAKKEGTGFLKNRRKKDRKKSTKSKTEDDRSDDDRRSETPTPDQMDEDSSKQNRLSAAETATDPWADFNQPTKKSFYSSSDSDSEDESVIKKINVKIKDINEVKGAATSASVDEIHTALKGIELNVSTLPNNRRGTPNQDFNDGVKRSQSTNMLAPGKASQDLAFLAFPDPADMSTISTGGTELSGGAPGAESTRLDVSATSAISNTSKEVSDFLKDLIDTPAEQQQPPTSTPPSTPPPPTSTPPLPASGWPDPAAWPDPVQPSLPPKQSQVAQANGSPSPRPASVQREKIANSLIPLPRPPSRVSQQARHRGTPSPTPTSLLPNTSLSISRSGSIGERNNKPGEPSRDSPRSALDNGPRSPLTQDNGPRPNNLLPEKTRVHSLGGADPLPPSLSQDRNRIHSLGRAGPILPTPRSDSPLTNSQASTPPLHPTLAPSRGPSPLTLGGADSVPLAVAFQEVVHAAFRGADESRCLVRLLGDMMLSFPAGIVSVLAANPYPAPLQFRILNSGRLTSVLPNKQLVSKVKNQCTADIQVFEFNMHSLQELLRKQAELNPMASYFNIDILKYQIASHPGAGSCPLQMVSYWKCETDHTDLRLDYKFNQHAMARAAPLLGVSIAVPIDGGVINMTSQPKGTWMGESNRALWKFPDLSANNGGVGSVRARFQLTDGPGSQGTIAAQFNCEGTTLSGVEFELTGGGYRCSLVKRRFVSGKYVSESDGGGDRYRYAAPPSFASDC